MAAPSGTVWGSVVKGDTSGRQGKIGIYTSVSSTNTQTTVNIQVWFWTIYSCSDGTNNFYCNIGTDVTSATTKIGSASINHTYNTGSGWNTANQTRLYNVTKPYTRGTSAVTYKVYAKYNGIDILNGTMSANTSFTVPALTKYTVSFNANGGSGAPSSQSKYYGKTLTLSSTKPTRSGYAFVGWGTSATDTSSDYAAGGSYTANASDTLHAIWKKTITLSYNANGGSGAPSSQTATVYNATTSYKFTLSSSKPTKTGHSFQGWSESNTATSASYSAGGTITLSANDTLYAVWKADTYAVKFNANGGSLGSMPSSATKTYGVTLTLPTAKPTRTNYTFLGWATSSSATTATYQPGASYTSNSAVTLHAVWKLAYIKPTIKITSLTMIKDSDGKITGCKVGYSWSCMSGYLPTKMTLAYTSASDSGGTKTLTTPSTASGTGTYTVTYAFNPDYTYTFVLTLVDSQDSYTASKRIDGTPYTVHCRPGGKGIAFGKTAEKDGYADFGFNIHVNNNKSIHGTDIDGAYKEAFNPVNTYGNTILGFGNYDKQSGNTNIYGHDINFGVSNMATPGTFRPYRRQGDSITLTLRTSGFVTGSGTNVMFWIPMSVPIVGSPTATITSGNGFTLRQGTKYTHGSYADTRVHPSSYEVVVAHANGISVRAIFDDVTNVTNNDAIGIDWHGTVTFT